MVTTSSFEAACIIYEANKQKLVILRSIRIIVTEIKETRVIQYIFNSIGSVDK